MQPANSLPAPSSRPQQSVFQALLAKLQHAPCDAAHPDLIEYLEAAETVNRITTSPQAPYSEHKQIAFTYTLYAYRNGIYTKDEITRFVANFEYPLDDVDSGIAQAYAFIHGGYITPLK